jgi:hypothetical protein
LPAENPPIRAIVGDRHACSVHNEAVPEGKRISRGFRGFADAMLTIAIIAPRRD